MKNYYSFLILILVFSLGIANKAEAQTFNYDYSPQIQAIVDDVKIDTMWTKLAYLQTQQRFTYSSGSLSTANYLKAYMKTLGFDSVYFQNYTIPGHTIVSPNIIGIKFGEINPDSIFIACGHWDAYADMAPGADDNGSGTVSVLEAARVLLKQNYSKTLKFCLFSGEEEGLWGSYRYVSASAGDKIGAALNLDMVSYQEPGHNLRIGVFPKSGMLNLYNKVNTLQQLYVPGIEIGKELGCSYSCTDVYSFWDAGYDGLFFFESSSLGSLETPYYHTSNDLINLSANSQPKLEKTTKIVVASLATWAELTPVSIKENYTPIRSLSNYPNPFSQQTTISFQLNSSNKISLRITDAAGKLIATLINNEIKNAGIYEVSFDASLLESGLYFYHIISEKGSITQKMMLIKQ